MTNPGSTLRWIIPSHEFSPREQFAGAAWHTLFHRAFLTNFTVPHEKYRLILDQCVPGFSSGQDVPVAALERKGAGIDAGNFSWAMCADPVEMTPNRHFLMLLGQSSFSLQFDEAQRLVATLNAHFNADGLQFVCVDAMHWIVQSSSGETMQTTPLSMAAGKDVRYVLPQGGQAMRWHSYLNEIQMVLFHHPVNQQRQSMGKTLVNSVWFWGGGCLPARDSISASPQTVCGTSYFTRGLCEHFGLEYVNEDALLTALTSNGQDRFLLVSDQEFSGPAAYDQHHYFSHLTDIADKLITAVKSGRLAELEVISLENRYVLRPDAFGWRRFFRQRS